MDKSELLEILAGAVKELEEADDIVIVTPIENAVAKKILSVIEKLIPDMLSRDELVGITNAIRAHQLGFALDDHDFQTIVGITKEELEVAAKKLNRCHEST